MPESGSVKLSHDAASLAVLGVAAASCLCLLQEVDMQGMGGVASCRRGNPKQAGAAGRANFCAREHQARLRVENSTRQGRRAVHPHCCARHVRRQARACLVDCHNCDKVTAALG